MKLLGMNLKTGLAVLLALALGQAALGATMDGAVKSATAISSIYGNGQRLTAVALEYDHPIDSARLTTASFKVEGRTITQVYANDVATPLASGTPRKNGRFVIVELSPDDANASLYAVDRMSFVRKEAKATLTQQAPIATDTGAKLAPAAASVTTSKVSNLIVDDFRQLEYKDSKTGDTLKYNLFVPKQYDPAKSYPLVLFMHDAGATSEVTTTTLVQGLGAVVWAGPMEQAKHEAFVLAPQYSTPVVNDNSEATSALDSTVDLVHALAGQYNIDTKRLYATGQSGGAMMSIAMNIKYPDLFAASFLVAGQWDPAKVAPLAKDKLWIVVSQGDLKAYPGENAMTAVYEKEGAKVARAVWDGTSTPSQFTAAASAMQAESAPINYVALKLGTVVPPGQTDDGGSNHVNTWRIAYTIEAIRDWLFRQHK